MNPATGTFTTMDTSAGSICDPTSLHKYLYANANPVTYVDSSGYFGLTDVVCANAIGDMLFYGISAGIINVGLNLIREIRAANKYGTKVDFAYVITMSFVEGFLVGSFFGGCSILASSLNSAIIQTALGGTSFLFGSISLAQSQNDLENHDYDLMVLDIIFATGGFVAAERCFDSAAEISSAKNTAETVTVPTPENTNTVTDKTSASNYSANKASFDSRGYHPEPGERTFNGYVKKNVNIEAEIVLRTKSPGFNNNANGVGGQFKRIGAGEHGTISPHVHQPIRNDAGNGYIYGSTGSKTQNGGVTYPSRRDITQLYEYLENGKYH